MTLLLTLEIYEFRKNIYFRQIVQFGAATTSTKSKKSKPVENSSGIVSSAGTNSLFIGRDTFELGKLLLEESERPDI